METEARIARTASRRTPAFTLIELLVVVAIISLLISILLPSLSKAREQAKQVKCVSNMRQIGVAMCNYFLDEKEWFPFGKRNELGLHGFYYGGHPGRPDWWGYTWQEYRDTPGGRPFNRYLYPDMPRYDVLPEDPQYEAVRQMPVFQCPSDTGGFWSSDPGDTPMSKELYWVTGNSYDENYHFIARWVHGARNEQRWLHLANAFVQVQMQQHASEFIIAYEDPFDSAQWLYIPRRGWHREWNRHNLLFLDGHAANTYTDTTKGWRGLGWKSCSGTWWNPRQSDPDKKYFDLLPLPGP
jgi:prepilin-type N-terminal cleavage/methylation domain-containing protein/prepilin-type processing-associated H-X9-DG protein